MAALVLTLFAIASFAKPSLSSNVESKSFERVLALTSQGKPLFRSTYKIDVT